MQPTPSRQTPDADAVSRISDPQGFSPADLRDAPGDDEASRLVANEQSPDEAEGTGDTLDLDDVARRERDDMRPRLRDELGREPTEEELDEWLRRHTEGY